MEYKQSTEELLAILETYQESILKPSNDKSILKGKITLFDYESIVNKALNGSVIIDMIWVTKSKDKVMFKTNDREVLIIIVPKNYLKMSDTKTFPVFYTFDRNRRECTNMTLEKSIVHQFTKNFFVK